MTSTDVQALVQTLVSRARDLGLTWGLRPATIRDATSGSITAVYDGDTVAVRVMSLIGRTYVGQRVMCVFVPPAGNYIIGASGDHQAGALIKRAERETAPSTTTTELEVMRLDNIPLRVGLAYQFTCSNFVLDSSVNGDAVFSRLRMSTTGEATISSDIFSGVQLPASSSSGQSVVPIVKNYYPAQDEIMSVLMTVGRAAGTGNVSIVLGTGFPIELSVVCRGADTGNDVVVL